MTTTATMHTGLHTQHAYGHTICPVYMHTSSLDPMYIDLSRPTWSCSCLSPMAGVGARCLVEPACTRLSSGLIQVESWLDASGSDCAERGDYRRIPKWDAADAAQCCSTNPQFLAYLKIPSPYTKDNMLCKEQIGLHIVIIANPEHARKRFGLSLWPEAARACAPQLGGPRGANMAVAVVTTNK